MSLSPDVSGLLTKCRDFEKTTLLKTRKQTSFDKNKIHKKQVLIKIKYEHNNLLQS